MSDQRHGGRQSLLDRAAVRVLEGVGARLWGFAPRLMPVIVAELGGGPALLWFVSNMPRYEKTFKIFGAARTHLVASVISLLSGCKYCTFGHAYAFQLVVLRDRGFLFPIDEGGFLALAGEAPAVIRERLAKALGKAGMTEEIAALDRLLEIHAGAAAVSDEDRRLAHLVEMFAVLNRCGIAGDVVPDAAHDPANKDEALKVRYEKLRRGERGDG